MKWKFWIRTDSDYNKLEDIVNDLTKQVDELNPENPKTKRFRYKKDGVTKVYF